MREEIDEGVNWSKKTCTLVAALKQKDGKPIYKEMLKSMMTKNLLYF